MVFPVFYEASGTSARDYPHEPPASKPCRPRVVCTTHILSAGRGLKNRTRTESVVGGPASVACLVRRRPRPGAARPCTPWSVALLRDPVPRLRTTVQRQGPKRQAPNDRSL